MKEYKCKDCEDYATKQEIIEMYDYHRVEHNPYCKLYSKWINSKEDKACDNITPNIKNYPGCEIIGDERQ